MSDNRRHPRFAISQMLTLQKGKEQVIHAQGVNISRSGLRCSCLDRLIPGSMAYLVLELQGAGVSRVAAEAVVVWCDAAGSGYDAGLMFRTLYENSAKALDQFLTPKETALDRPAL